MGTQGKTMHYSQALALATHLQQLIKSCYPTVTVHIAGSLRRKRDIINDIDLLIVTTSGILPAGMRALFTFTSLGDKIGTAIVDGVQIDFMACKREEEATALLHFTGSRWHNIKMRNAALAQGCLLSQYGLTIAGTLCHFTSEAEVFAALGMKYKLPSERN